MAERIVQSGARYQQYAEYKDSGIRRLGQVPINWKVSRLKNVLKIRNGRDYKDVEVESGGYPVYGSGGIFKRSSSYLYDGKSILFGRKGTVDKPLLVSGRFWTVDTMFYSEVFDNALLEYIYYQALIFPFDLLTTNTALPSMTQEDLLELNITLPPMNEQTQITKFLDHETAQIDTLIEKQQALIQLLKEKRQAVISHAVTKGLNPDVPMKDSGVEWLGEVPADWEVTKAKYISKVFIPQRNKPELNDVEGCPWVTMEDMKMQYIDKVHRYVKSESMKESGSKVLKAGAVIASCVGNFGVTSINRVDVIINQQLQAFQPKGIKPEYLQAIVALSKSYFELIGTAATLIYVNREGFENLPVIVPTTQEQEAISEFISIKSKQFDLLVFKAEQAIQLMQERRTALISAAVTGKIDVRGWVAPE